MSGPAAVPDPASLQHATYTSFVTADGDVIGCIAYAIYKREKLDFVSQIQALHGRPPTADEIRIFIQTVNNRLPQYRVQAAGLFESLMEYQLEDAVADANRAAEATYHRRLEESKSWGRSIADALIGVGVQALVWIAIVLSVYTSKIGPDQIARELLAPNGPPSAGQQK